MKTIGVKSIGMEKCSGQKINLDGPQGVAKASACGVSRRD
jgi:hypothetical protein